MASIAEILKQRIGEVEKPPTWPDGTYQWVIREPVELLDPTEKAGARAVVTLGAIQPLEGVDMAVYQKVNSGGARTLKYSIFLDDDNGYDLSLILKACGLTGDMDENIPRAQGQQFVSRLYKNKKGYPVLTDHRPVA